jgi:hypothetical protein
MDIIEKKVLCNYLVLLLIEEYHTVYRLIMCYKNFFPKILNNNVGIKIKFR